MVQNETSASGINIILSPGFISAMCWQVTLRYGIKRDALLALTRLMFH